MTASSNVFKTSVLLAAAILAAGLLVLVTAANQAGAAFPGRNGKIAFASVTVNSTGSDNDIWRMNLDGTNQQPLTSSSGMDTDPTYSPNGKSIAFLSNRDGTTSRKTGSTKDLLSRSSRKASKAP
jgi:Tol biopolymer transport system component